jgi:lysophospholipase L1-like esterase
MIRRVRRKLFIAAYISVATLVLVEGLVRLSGYSQHHLCDPIYMSFTTAPEEIPYVHKPNLSQARARGLAIINTDSLGLRSVTVGQKYLPREVGEYRIALVGDSVTFGEGVAKTTDTFAQVLEDQLNREQATHRVKVFNFGASAYNVQVMAATLRRRMLEVQPNLVLMAIIPSDFNLSRTPSVDRWGYLSDKKMSGFLPGDSSVRLALRKVHTIYLLRDVISPWIENSRGAEQDLSAGQMPAAYSFVKDFKDTAEKQNLAYEVLLLPSFSDYGHLRTQMQRDRVSFIDLSQVRGELSPDQFHASRFDPHPSALAHRRIGERLAEYVLANYLTVSNSRR